MTDQPAEIDARVREAIDLWEDNGLTLDFLEAMSYSHRVALFEAARRYLRLVEGNPK